MLSLRIKYGKITLPCEKNKQWKWPVKNGRVVKLIETNENHLKMAVCDTDWYTHYVTALFVGYYENGSIFMRSALICPPKVYKFLSWTRRFLILFLNRK